MASSSVNTGAGASVPAQPHMRLARNASELPLRSSLAVVGSAARVVLREEGFVFSTCQRLSASETTAVRVALSFPHICLTASFCLIADPGRCMLRHRKATCVCGDKRCNVMFALHL